MKKTQTAENYRAWEVHEADWPYQGSIDTKINYLLRYAVLAPSVHNTQPWVFSVREGVLTIAPNHAIRLVHHDPENRHLYLSLGTCMANFIIAAQYFGLACDIKTTKQHTATIAVKPQPAVANTRIVRLFKAISARRSNKFPYKQRPVPGFIIDRLEGLSGKTVKISVITERMAIQSIAKLHASSMAAAASPELAKELADWLRLPKTKDHDGMPGFVVGLSQGQTKLIRWLITKKPQLLKLLAKKDRKLIAAAPAAIIISSQGDTINDWLAAGQKLEEVLLEATAAGLAVHPMTASIENKQAKQELTTLAGVDDVHAQALVRIGFPTLIPPHTPRKDYHQLHEQAFSAMDQLVAVVGVPLQSHQVEIGKYTINYVVAGKGQPLLLIHGANIGWPQWYKNIQALAENFKVYAIDLPGAGDSTKLKFSNAHFEKDFLDIVDQFIDLQNWQQVDVVGSSFGGWIAMGLAARNKPQIRKVVLTNPIGFIDYIPPKYRPIAITPMAKMMTKTVLKPVRGNDKLEGFMREVFGDKYLPLAPEFVDYFFELSKTSHNALFISRLTRLKGMAKGLFQPEMMRSIKKPVLVIWGQKDPLMPYERVKENFKLLKTAKVHLLPNVGHMPPVEDSHKFNELVTNYLKD